MTEDELGTTELKVACVDINAVKVSASASASAPNGGGGGGTHSHDYRIALAKRRAKYSKKYVY